MFTAVLYFEGRSELQGLHDRESLANSFEFAQFTVTGHIKADVWTLAADRPFSNPEDPSLNELVGVVKKFASDKIRHLKLIEIRASVDTKVIGGTTRLFGKNCGPMWSEIGVTSSSTFPEGRKLYVSIASPLLVEESLIEFAKALPKFIRNIRICDLASRAQDRLERQHDYVGVKRDLVTILKLAGQACQQIPQEH